MSKRREAVRLVGSLRQRASPTRKKAGVSRPGAGWTAACSRSGASCALYLSALDMPSSISSCSRAVSTRTSRSDPCWSTVSRARPPVAWCSVERKFACRSAGVYMRASICSSISRRDVHATLCSSSRSIDESRCTTTDGGRPVPVARRSESISARASADLFLRRWLSLESAATCCPIDTSSDACHRCSLRSTASNTCAIAAPAARSSATAAASSGPRNSGDASGAHAPTRACTASRAMAPPGAGAASARGLSRGAASPANETKRQSRRMDTPGKWSWISSGCSSAAAPSANKAVWPRGPPAASPPSGIGNALGLDSAHAGSKARETSAPRTQATRAFLLAS
mmetsp:Transcript_3356/g.10414  ORF Transcript_3356/g.10414 Transcript_3356/m.10414 type:complete len:341 (-) Transcript_3356:395-1417(-)